MKFLGSICLLTLLFLEASAQLYYCYFCVKICPKTPTVTICGFPKCMSMSATYPITGESLIFKSCSVVNEGELMFCKILLSGTPEEKRGLAKQLGNEKMAELRFTSCKVCEGNKCNNSRKTTEPFIVIGLLTLLINVVLLQ